nr:UPF0503 protein At3g09070, chloroplastic-like [Ipomoea trifida]
MAGAELAKAMLPEIHRQPPPPRRISGVADKKVESKNIWFSKLAHCDEELVEDAEIGEEIRDPVNTLQPNLEAANDDVSMGGELKTMKEYIDLEIHSKSQKPKDLKDIARNF